MAARDRTRSPARGPRNFAAAHSIEQANAWRISAEKGVRDRANDLGTAQASLVTVSADRVATRILAAEAKADATTMAAIEQTAANHAQKADMQSSVATQNVIRADMELEEANTHYVEGANNYKTAQKFLSEAVATYTINQATLESAQTLEKRQDQIASLAQQEAQAAQEPAEDARKALALAEGAENQAKAQEESAKSKAKSKEDAHDKSKKHREAAQKEENDAKKKASKAKEKERKAFADLQIADRKKQSAAESDIHCEQMSKQSEALSIMGEASAQALLAAMNPAGVAPAALSTAQAGIAQAKSIAAQQIKKIAESAAESADGDQKNATSKRDEAEKVLNEKCDEHAKWAKQASQDLAILREATEVAQKASFQAVAARLAKERAAETSKNAEGVLAMKQAQAKSRREEHEAAKRSAKEAMEAVEAATTRLAEARRLFATRDSELQVARVHLENAGLGAAKCRKSEELLWEESQKKKLELIWAADTRARTDAVAETCRLNCLGYAREEGLAEADVARSQRLLALGTEAANVLARDLQQVEECAKVLVFSEQ